MIRIRGLVVDLVLKQSLRHGMKRSITNTTLIKIYMITLTSHLIRLWDNNAGNILCSKSNPINIGSGEVGCEDGNLNGTQNVTTSPERKKRKASLIESTEGLKDVIQSFTAICKEYTTSQISTNTSEAKSSNNKSLEDMSLQELFETSDQIKRQIQFLEEMNVLDDEEKDDFIQQTRKFFEEIKKRMSQQVS